MKFKAAAFVAPLIVAAALLAGTSQANAQVTLTFDPASLVGAAGQTIAVSGTIQNLGSDPVFLNGDLFTASAPGLMFDDSPFYGNAPSELTAAGDPNASYTGVLFNLTFAPDASGNYAGVFDLIGGADANADGPTDILATTPFQASAVPEPSSLALFGIGAVLLGAMVSTRRKPRNA